MFPANAERVDSLMDAADLKVFATVARIGGMNRAANELHTVQSNVTARVRTLEEELGAQLFHRGQKGVTAFSRAASRPRASNSNSNSREIYPTG